MKLLLDGRTTVIKSNLSRADAEKYKAMYDSTGAVSTIVASAVEAAVEPAVALAAEATTAPPMPLDTSRQPSPALRAPSPPKERG